MSNSNFLDPKILCLNPNYPWSGVQNPLIWILELKIKLLFGEVQTSDWISKSFEIYLNSSKSIRQNFENCFPVPILLLAQPPCSASLFSLYFCSKLFGPLAFEAHLPSQPKTPCVFFKLQPEKISNAAAPNETSAAATLATGQGLRSPPQHGTKSPRHPLLFPSFKRRFPLHFPSQNR
jgi:hypothetical protein